MISKKVRDAIREQGPASTIYISHGAGPEDWFVVEPQVGTDRSMANTQITTEMAVESLRRAGRTVYKLDVQPWINDHEATEVIDVRLGLFARLWRR